MSQDNPKRLILSYQKVDVTYIFHILLKYMSFTMVLYNVYDFHIVNPLQKTVTTNFRLNTLEQMWTCYFWQNKSQEHDLARSFKNHCKVDKTVMSVTPKM